MEGTANLVVYRKGEIIRNTHEGVRFVCCSMYHDIHGASERFLSKYGERYVEESEQYFVPKSEAYGIQNDLDIEDDIAADFEATYEAGDEDEDGDIGVKAATKNVMALLIMRTESSELEWNIILECRLSQQLEVTLSLEESTTMCMSLSHRRSMQNARCMGVGAIGLSDPT
ncbi:hypothetical protein Ahy_A07g034642 isoform B [Arachis hypogaea]|uniref:Uncharacterized protein n=1 Tax=Arachis hypogaea TaxID=3818 RepID=A0A445CCD1_ARAHY|nr:hypothetical protein Ahy_A07g034642 isoform B [Arachis hypogaea]